MLFTAAVKQLEDMEGPTGPLHEELEKLKDKHRQGIAKQELSADDLRHLQALASPRLLTVWFNSWYVHYWFAFSLSWRRGEEDVVLQLHLPPMCSRCVCGMLVGHSHADIFLSGLFGLVSDLCRQYLNEEQVWSGLVVEVRAPIWHYLCS